MVKVGVILLKFDSKGFSLIEVIAAFSILLTILITFVPIAYQLKLEENILSNRRNIQSVLHDQLQTYLFSSNTSSFPTHTNLIIDNREVYITFMNENQWIKGCANWENAKQNKENFCLYGYPSQ